MLPNLEDYQGDIISRVAAATEMDVSASAIRGGWSGFRPYVDLENVVFRETASSTAPDRVAGAEALKLPRMTASLSWWSLLLGQIRFVDVALEAPALSLSRGKDGLVYFAGRALNTPTKEQDDGRLVEWLLEQPGVDIQHATLAWTDQLTPGKTLLFTDLGLHIEKRLTGHAFGLVATPPSALGKKLEARGLLTLQKMDGHWIVVGNIYSDATDTNFTELRAYLPALEALQAGVGNARAWVDVDNSLATAQIIATASAANAANAAAASTTPGVVKAITADLNLLNARVQLSANASPLNIARLAGRIEYKAEDGGFAIGSKALEFRTREGVNLPAADFLLTLQHQADPLRAKGEMTAKGIDLKAMTALLEYLPVSKEIRAKAMRLNPRGIVGQSSVAWVGHFENLLAYRIKGSVSDFAIDADASVPGVSGFSGSIDGDEKGGKFIVASKNLQLDTPNIMRQPLKFDALDSEGTWKMSADGVDVEFTRVAFANADLAGEFNGRYSRHHANGAKSKEEKGPGSLDIKGKLTRAKALAVANYLPNAAAQTREYIEWAVRNGEISSAEFALKGEIFEFPFHKGKGGNFRLAAKVKGLDFRYATGWPIAEKINGELVFENTGFMAKVESGQFFNAKLKATTIAVDDFALRPYLLSIQGQTDANGEDVARFLRESPLISGVGAFTKSVAIEGPGSLELSMKIPIGAIDQGKVATKINGKYTLRRGQAKPVVGPLVTALTGSVDFTESGVKSSGIVGTAYGNPLTLSINSGNDGVVTDFAGRAEVSQLTDVLPFPMPQQVKGVTDFNGRITTKEGGAEIVIDSSLVGVASSLPAPLTKRSDEARKLRVTIADTGQKNEKISVTLAGNAMAGVAPAAADASTSRIDARFQRRFDTTGNALGLRGGVASVGVPVNEAVVPEGLWFAGTMPLLDFDLWRQAVDNFYPAVVAKTPDSAARPVDKSAIEIAGFDFKLGGLVAYGRPFDTMTLKGRHAGDDWRLTVDSDDAVGDISWRAAAFGDRGAVRARLQKLVVADEVPPPKGSTAGSAAPLIETGRVADFPALDIIAEKFFLKDRELGKLELRATPMGDNWRVDQLAISIGHAKLMMDGLWQRYGDPQRAPGITEKSLTTMNLKVESSNLNALFSQFGFGDQLKRGTGKLEGKLSWPGHVYQFQTATLSGQFQIEGRNGQFAKIPVGAGKLLSLISLQSIPRRFTLDFRDVFSEGFAFERIDGNIKINNGIMFTDNFEIVGTAANVKMSGDVSLPAEQTNLKLTVVPSLGEGVAIGAGVVLGPVGGLGVLLAQKLLQGALSYEYAVTGSWDNPQVVKINNNLPATKPGNVPTAPLTPSAPVRPADAAKKPT